MAGIVSIETVIEATDLSDFAVYEGDCVNIAVALQRVFGRQLVASYASEVEFHEGEPAHTAVRVDGTLYDGGGVTSEEALRDRAYYGVSEQDWEDIVVTEISQPDRKLLDIEAVEELVAEFDAVR